MKICYVTDRKALAASGGEQVRMVLEKIGSAARAGVDWIQIREKDLSGRELVALASEAVRRAPVSCRILVNDRLDVALAAGAGGVHLGEHSIPVEELKRFLREKSVSAEFFVGVSTHSIDAAGAAEAGGADYIIFGPVFQTPSKAAFGAPQGLVKLREVCERVRIPVIAIGGLTMTNFAQCITAGAAGIAAIRLFQDEPNLSALLQTLRT
jgi:thiamine-phosphate pyrophosphorylase